MPDWTYHPFFKPVLFRMGAEEGRRLTLRLLEVQSRTAAGRRLFRLFGHGIPPSALAVDAFGVRFPGPLGIGPGIDTHGISTSVLQYLGLGYVCVGPAGVDAVARRFDRDPIRVEPRHAIASTPLAGAPSVSEIAAGLARSKAIEIPIGVAIRGRDLAAAARAAEASASFVVLPPSVARDRDALASIRAATKRPIVLRLSPDSSEEELDRIAGAAIEAGVNGAVVFAGASTELLEDGELTGPFLRARALAAVERLAKRHGDRFPIIGSGGIMSPEDALSFLDAGARLVELFEGLVYAGPGLPGRIIHALEHRERKTPPVPVLARVDPPPAAFVWGQRLLTFTGLTLVAAGLGALILAATIELFPYDTAYLGMTVEQLCAMNACRIVHFMAHDRVSFGGSIISIGAVYLWIAASPLRRGEPWAWWVLLISGLVGFASFLTYLGYGYLDVWHGRATVALLVVYLAGMVLAYSGLSRPRGPMSLFRSGAKAWLYSPAGLGRALLTFSATGMILGGVTIMFVGVTRVFVPQDLEYMGISVAELHAISPRLVPLIAHDRAGFGGGLLSGGLTIMFSLWCGARPGAKGLWWALLAAGVIGFGTAIGIHPIVGYTSFIHLLPAYAGAIAFLLGIRLLHAPMCKADGAGDRFSDLG